MRIRSTWLLSSLPVALLACATVPGAGDSVPADDVAQSAAALVDTAGLTAVPTANTKVAGLARPHVLSPELAQVTVAQGSVPLENPASIPLSAGGTVDIGYYGYAGTGPMVPAPGAVQAVGSNVEAKKTEPDKNTYLVLAGQTGPDPVYSYGTHFLFQGHEGGVSGVGYITRVNLDADAAHQVTMWAATDKDGVPLATIDGSTWDPFAQRLIFTTENSGAAEYSSTLTFPPVVEDISGAIGRGGYEGVQNDAAGNLWIVEDVGGASGAVNKSAKQPNSFIYRFVPKTLNTLTEGKLQVLQVRSRILGTPIVFHPGQADADILSPDVADLHSYGKVFHTRWITIHDTDVDGTAPFSANALAKTLAGTPFKRPENGVFRPGLSNTEFYFSETGDTNLGTQAGSAYGGFGGVFKLTQARPSSPDGQLTILYVGDAAHTGFDNTSFYTKDTIVFVEDAGDGLHAQRNALDSAYLLDVTANYADPANVPTRILAEGRDPSATIDSALSSSPGFNNDGDNEITGFHVSDGDPSIGGILGAKVPTPFKNGWRAFYTAQHGDNATYEIIPRPGH